jgi:5'(3')-deoxyribonucleotidase
MTQPRILVDMDCVLADFVAAAAKAHGVPADALLTPSNWPPGEYGCYEPFGRLAVGRPFSAFEFWKPINADPKFWRTIPRLPWADDLMELVRSLTADYWFVTSPSRCDNCVRGKEDWVKAHYGEPHDRVVPTPHKYLLAVTARGPAVLVDDHEKNVEEFRAAGGLAVLFPAHHNQLHQYAADPLPWVAEGLHLALNPVRSDV